MERILLFIFALFMLWACGTEEDVKVKRALKQAGKNRGELEKILAHYSINPADSMKLRAARFLIGNMPGHYFLEGEKIERYRKIIYADSCFKLSSKIEAEVVLTLDDDVYEESDKIQDIKYITADFLIRHIDASFEILQKYTWLSDIPFDIFLEYLLPYRVAYERPLPWRDSLWVLPEFQQMRLFDSENISSFRDFELEISLSETGEKNSFWELISPSAVYDDCRLGVYQSLFRARAKGIPLVLDYIPHYSNRNGYHYWLMQPPLYLKKYNIEGAFDRRTAKVYRRTFSHNPVLKRKRDEYIPALFLDPFNKDVTELYFYTQDIQVPVRWKVPDREHHAYLCVFNNLAWKPIAAGEFNGKKASFAKIGMNSVFLPIVYNQWEEQQAFNYPFVHCLDRKVQELIPDTGRLRKLRLVRKNPEKQNLAYYCNGFKNTTVCASKNKSLREADTIFKLNEAEKGLYYSVTTENPRPYRYYQIKPSFPGVVCVAEWFFFDSNDKEVKIKAASPNDKNAFDGDPLTYASLPKDTLLTIDFGEPVVIKRVVCLPRSDGNGIYLGDVYELLYYDIGGWCSLGEKEATDFYVEYDQVPSGALYWLRNLTGGVEERIFTWENEKQRFW